MTSEERLRYSANIRRYRKAVREVARTVCVGTQRELVACLERLGWYYTSHVRDSAFTCQELVRVHYMDPLYGKRKRRVISQLDLGPQGRVLPPYDQPTIPELAQWDHDVWAPLRGPYYVPGARVWRRG